MKIAYCPECFDFFKLIKVVRACKCGKSSGVLKPDGLMVVLNGPTEVVGIDDRSFFKALKKRLKKGPGINFRAYLCPTENKSVTRLGE